MQLVTLVMGGSGGLGREVARQLSVRNEMSYVSDWSRETGVDLCSTYSVNKAVGALVRGRCCVDRIVNCAGVNAIREFDDLSFYKAGLLYNANALALPRVVQSLRRKNRIINRTMVCNVISNAAHLPMSHSLMYNASKAAQEMITRQMARELKEYCIFGVNPNKISGTAMSKHIENKVMEMRGWTRKKAREYQLAALPAGVETPPESIAAFIVDLMQERHNPYITGCIFPYGGPQ